MKRLLALLLFVAACGGDEDRVSAYIGSWMYNSGSILNIDCDNNIADSMTMLTTTFSVTAGTMSDLVVLVDSRCAPLRMDVTGSEASIQAGQTCMTMEAGGVNVMSTYNTGTAKLDEAGTRIEIDIKASAQTSGSLTTTCSATVLGSATKVGQ